MDGSCSMEAIAMEEIKCTYAGKKYGPGSIVMQTGIKMRAGEDGKWHKHHEMADKTAATAALAAICDYAGQPYSEGSLICQAGSQMRCTNNSVWSATGVAC
jgi:hypothetical protein